MKKIIISEAALKLQNAIFEKNGDKMVTFQAAEGCAETKKALNNDVKCLKTDDVFLVSRAGVEPTTYGLKVRCSTN